MSQHDQDARMREAALVLHGLHWRDRLWLLRKLLPSWRSRLAGLLRELRELGIEPAFGGSADLPACLPLSGLDGAALSVVDQASSARIQALLAAEAPTMQAIIFSLHAWRWRETVWRDFSGLQRRRLLAQAKALELLTRGAAEAVLATLATALREEGAAKTTSGASGGQR
jgi:hypothetical protein